MFEISRQPIQIVHVALPQEVQWWIQWANMELVRFEWGEESKVEYKMPTNNQGIGKNCSAQPDLEW
jgi:hypothetical protein